ncbi:MAG: sulfotransferase [Verrucomicrobiales bacterium]|nr:sulfotransferase [Verrucomicrobiales bacterium]
MERAHRPPSGREPGAAASGAPETIPGLGTDLPGLRRARALWQANRFDESLELFEQTARDHPQNLVALVDGSRALGARFEIRRAEVLLERLLKVGRTRPDLLHLAGQCYRMMFRPQQAEDCFLRVLSMTRKIPDAFLELAVLRERMHRVDDALALVEDCLRAAPDYSEASLFKARLLRRLGRDTESTSLLRHLTTATGVHPLVAAQAWAEIAQSLDRTGDYRAAMDAMLRCKAILLPRSEPVRRESEFVLHHLGNLAQSLDRPHFQRWAEQARPFAPARTAVLTGFPRSGTTLIEQVLDSHSDLVSSDEREAFARDIFPAMWLGPATPAPTAEALDATALPRLEALRHRYLGFMEAALHEPIGSRMHLDKNPPMTLVLPGFLRLFPETRVLIALRDPRDVVISCFLQYLPLNPNSVCFLTLEDTARRFANDLGVWLRLREIIASPWLEVRYEETVQHLEREARRALEFLGLPWEPQVLDYRRRLDTKRVGSPTYQDVRQPLYTRAIGRWRNYEEFLEPHLHLLDPVLDALGYRNR